MKAPLSSTPANARRSSGTTGAYWALTSTRGIRGTGLRQSRRAPTAQNQISRQQQNSCNDDEFDVAEILVKTLVARAEPPADTRKRETPERGAGERENRVAREPDPED